MKIINLNNLELKEVDNSSLKKKAIYEKQSLFSEAIFGPVNDFQCRCKIVTVRNGEICPHCGIKISSSIERRYTDGKIKLNLPIFHPFLYRIIIKNKNLKEILNNLYNGIKYSIVDDQLIENTSTGEYDIFNHPEKVIESYIKTYYNNKSISNVILNNIDNLITNEIIIIPPEIRPMVGNIIDQLNVLYCDLISFNNSIIKNVLGDNENIFQIKVHNIKTLQKKVDALVEYVLERLKGKTGLLRNNLMGKRIDWSGRAVIIPDPNIPMTHCKIPYLILLELFKLKVAKKLVDNKDALFTQHAIELIEEDLNNKKHKYINELNEIIGNEYVILNRQPSLHRMSIMAFKPLISLNYCIGLNPLIELPFNADHDGDTMAIYVPLSKEAKIECEKLLWSINQSLSPSTAKIIFTPNRDIILGLYELTKDGDPKIHNIYEVVSADVDDEHIVTTYGRLIFNEILPEDFDYINCLIDKTKLMEIIEEIYNKYDKQTVQIILDKIKELGFKYCTLFQPTISMEQFNLGITRKEIEEKLTDDIYENNQMLTEKLNNLKDLFKLRDFIESGARGSWDQAKQLFLCKGYISNSKGQIIPTPIISSLFEGLNTEEYFISCFGTRKGIIDTSENTAKSGYITRMLVYNTASVTLGHLHNCGTDKYLDIYISDQKLLNSLDYRYYLDEETNSLKLINRNDTHLINKTIKLRSPMTCKSANICHTCYGDLSKIINSKQVGFIAAQSLGEIITQIVLRTFHLSGTATIKTKDTSDNNKINKKENEDVINDMKKLKNILFAKHLEYKQIEKLVIDLYNIYKQYSPIQLIHFEIVISQLLLYNLGDNKFKKLRLYEGEIDNNNIMYVSIKKGVALENWVNGLIFEDLFKNLIKGIIENKGNENVLTKIFLGKSLI